MPHDGHRTPQRARTLHGGNPSCLWVPVPRESGVKVATTINGAIKAPADPTARDRPQPDNVVRRLFHAISDTRFYRERSRG